MNPDCGCVVNSLLRVDRDLNVLGATPLLGRLPSGWQAGQVLREGGILESMPCTPGLNIRREIAEAMFPMPLDRPLNRFPDVMMMRLIPVLSRIAAIPAPLARWRIHGGNAYQRHRITAEFLGAEIQLCETVWEEQRRRLQKINPRIAALLAPLDAAPLIALQRYVLSRLAGSRIPPSVRKQTTGRMLASRTRLSHRVFWYATGFLPKSLFAFVVNLLIMPNSLKRAVFKVRQLRLPLTTPRTQQMEI
jgi:hypothetical protein